MAVGHLLRADAKTPLHEHGLLLAMLFSQDFPLCLLGIGHLPYGGMGSIISLG